MKLCSFILSASLILNSFCICAEKEEPFSKTEYQLYCLIRSAINTVQKTASKHNVKIGVDKACKKFSHLKSAPISTPVLEFTNGIPTALWTPWGEWEFNRSTVTFHPTDCKGMLKDLIAAFNLKLYSPQDLFLEISHGPAYSITTVGDQPLPIVMPAYKKLTLFELIPAGPEEKKSTRLWQAMTAKYSAEYDAIKGKLDKNPPTSDGKKS